MNTAYGMKYQESSGSRFRPIASKFAWFVLLLACSLAIFLLGPKHYPLFPTNGNVIYAASLTGIFLVAAIGLKRSENLSKYWGISYAFFIASAVILVTDLLGKYSFDFRQTFGRGAGENQIMALDKVYETLLVVITILGLTLISGANLGSIFLTKGNAAHKWGLMIGGMLLVDYFTSVLIFFGSGYALPKLASAIGWGLVFAFSNSMLEELWMRGIFIKKLIPILGGVGTVLLTSMSFAAMHFLGVAYLPLAVVPIFVVNTLVMGLACGLLMVKTDSIWGAYLIHAAADLFLFIATLAVH